ncbi:MAG TPA: T9SS type A sorting domain-containing protein, partial [Bacteroidia bacterium]|nr:T9SS type A sorting domain-containing protein [Bacteroidia bacterium]
LTFNPANEDEAFLTTETQGLWINHDLHSPNSFWTLVGSYPFRQPERVYFNPYNADEVWVSSFGNGLKVGSMSNATGMIDFGDAVAQLYPNPNQGRFKLALPADVVGQVRVAVLDLAGRMVFSTMASPQGSVLAVDAAGLPKGIYVVKAAWESGSKTWKMIVD